MAFDETKDMTVAAWEHEDLAVSLRQYNGGAVKFQIGPRTVEKRDGSLTHRKAGRLSLDEMRWLAGIMPEIVESAEAASS
jgi:hypothetical protein